MPLFTTVEAAIKLGVGVELVEYFTRKCPKHGESRTLSTIKTDERVLIDEKVLIDYQRYLNLPWPVPPSGQRPGIPEKIKEDIRFESHLCCANCGHMDNGEVAHIEAVADTLNNSPDNLIYLCPNHHSKYDLGYKPKSNVTPEMVRAAKLLKRKSRQRMLAYEANAIKGLLGLIQLVKGIEGKVKNKANDNQLEILTTEAKKLIELIPNLTEAARKQARKDEPTSDVDILISKNAPTFARIAAGAKSAKSVSDVRNVMKSVSDKSHELLLEFDEVDCPHCGGRGMTGLIGDFCAYCRGSCLVTQEEADEYKPENIDEVECPHCGGRGTTGLTQIFCKFCRGSCVVTEEEAEEYDQSDIDEEECPHCSGRGTTGWKQNFCSYCHGDCTVSKEELDGYDPADIDEVDCPHCNGRGWRGRSQSTCGYCDGDSVVTKEQTDTYDPDKLDEVECPHCNGRGLIGRNDMLCDYCNGDNFVTSELAEAYDPDEIDEVECPKCHGRGTYGLRDDSCKLCGGNCVVTRDLRRQYIDKYGLD